MPNITQDSTAQATQLVTLKTTHWSVNIQEPVGQRRWSTGWYGGPENDWSDKPVYVTLAQALEWLNYLLTDGDLDPEWQWTIETRNFNS